MSRLASPVMAARHAVERAAAVLEMVDALVLESPVSYRLARASMRDAVYDLMKSVANEILSRSNVTDATYDNLVDGHKAWCQGIAAENKLECRRRFAESARLMMAAYEGLEGVDEDQD